MGAAGGGSFEPIAFACYVGPLYYSVDMGSADGGVHAIVLDSEEGVGGGNTISEAIDVAAARIWIGRSMPGGRSG